MRVGSFSRWRLGRLIFASAVVCYANARDSEIIASENKFSHIISLPRQSSIAPATARSALDCGDRSTAGSGYKEKFERTSLFFVSVQFGSVWGRSVGGGVGDLSALWPGDCCAIQRAEPQSRLKRVLIVLLSPPAPSGSLSTIWLPQTCGDRSTPANRCCILLRKAIIIHKNTRLRDSHRTASSQLIFNLSQRGSI